MMAPGSDGEAAPSGCAIPFDNGTAAIVPANSSHLRLSRIIAFLVCRIGKRRTLTGFRVFRTGRRSHDHLERRPERGRLRGSRASGVGGLAAGGGAAPIGPNFARMPRSV